MDEMLDGLEAVLVEYMQKVGSLAGRELSQQQARNVVGKIGSRIMFGKEVFDNAFTSVTKKEE